VKAIISIIIPSYNRAEYLRLASKSVLEQTYKNIEVISAYDGSTDNTAEVVASFNDPMKSQEILTKREEFVNYCFGPLDGKSNERIYNFICNNR
jgi:glycosyltransferase involved in cell wall biosynthesis